MWLVACVRCRTVDCHETESEARGRAEVHTLAHGCTEHTFFWKRETADLFFELHRAGEARRNRSLLNRAA